MNEVVTLKKLVDLLAQSTGADVSSADAFIHAFTHLVQDELEDGSQIKIKGLGVFLIEKDEGRHIAFAVDSELAQCLNAPFDMFEVVELEDTLTDDDLHQAGESTVAVAADCEVVDDDLQGDAETQELDEKRMGEEIATDAVASVDIEGDALQEDQQGEIQDERQLSPQECKQEETQGEETRREKDVVPPPYRKPNEDEIEAEKSIDDAFEKNPMLDRVVQTQRQIAQKSGISPMWIAIAAVLGLIIGFIAGYFMHAPEAL